MNSGATYRNYMGTFSIVLMALVDAQYRFIYIDVGVNGRVSDGGVFSRCSPNTALETNSLNIPIFAHYHTPRYRVLFIL